MLRIGCHINIEANGQRIELVLGLALYFGDTVGLDWSGLNCHIEYLYCQICQRLDENL